MGIVLLNTLIYLIFWVLDDKHRNKNMLEKTDNKHPKEYELIRN